MHCLPEPHGRINVVIISRKTISGRSGTLVDKVVIFLLNMRIFNRNITILAELNNNDPVPYHKGKEVGKGLEAKMRKDMKLK